MTTPTGDGDGWIELALSGMLELLKDEVQGVVHVTMPDGMIAVVHVSYAEAGEA